MATVGMVTEATEGAGNMDRERIGDRVCTIAAMVGGVAGAVVGALVDAALGIGYPTPLGVLGTMLGSVVCAAVGQTLVLPRLIARRGK